MANELELKVLEKAKGWLGEQYDEQTRQQVKYLMDNDMKELVESFYKDLEFGTGGLRGIMGAGTNRMNAYTTYLFDALRPTPELSFAIRELKCHSGVVITASHNPKEYNGYKAYWTDGAQVTAPHDRNIIEEVGRITDVGMIRTGLHPENIVVLGEDFDEKYLDRIHELSLSPESVKRRHDMKIVYTPLHGAGVRLVPASLRRFGFTNVTLVPEQSVVDGNFPTVESPNPEERKTMSKAIELAAREGADLVLATDPDSDRIGVALRNKQGEYVLLNGNQTLVLLMSYQLTRWAELGLLDGKQYVVKTIVTSQMANAVADRFGVKCYDCLTGFKYIAKIIRENEGKTKYIGGGEESFGYLAGDYVRDKDGVSACSLAAEAAAWAMDTMGLTLYEWLQELYVQYGLYREGLLPIVRKGKEGAEQIQRMMADFRATPPAAIRASATRCGGPNRAEACAADRTYDFRNMEISELQQRVDAWIKEYGVRYFSELTNMAVLTEEVGELARVMARKYGDQSFKAGEKEDLADEMADVLWVLVCLANQTGVDLTQALEANFAKKTGRDAGRHRSNPKL